MASQRLLGDWIRRRRADLNLTQELLAEQVGCAVDTIRALETGRRRASQPMAERLATVLHIPLEERPAFLAAAQASVQIPSASVVPDDPGKTARVAGQSTRLQTPVLLATKLYRPRLTQDVVVRPRLLERLDQGLAGPLTLISAPAGFGKTTLVAHRLNQLVLPSAWLALDAQDDAPPTFLRYLVAALRGIDPAIGAQMVPLLDLSDSAPPHAVIDALLNDLAAISHDSVLVLDDLHVLTHPAIYDALAYLLDHLPPQLHLVLLTREDPPLPLARLRARRQLVELRAADLRFTLAEADAFLHETMHLSLDADAITALMGRTEGWIVGLQLAALSLRDLGAQDVATAIDAFTSNHRYVVDYLVDEVIRGQPAHLQHFLLQTSMLERLCGPLCDAILGLEARDVRLVGTDTQQASSRGAPWAPQASQAYSQLILESLERANLFLVPLDSARHWYRYHHLFAEVLQTRLLSGAAPEQIRELRQRASAWCEKEGLLAEAVQYALAAHDWERATTLVEQVTPVMIQRSEIARLLSWFDTLPEEEVQARPRLALYYGWVLFLSGQITQAAARLSAIEAMLEADTAKLTPELQGHIAAIRAYRARLAGDFATTIALSRQALADLPEQDTLLQAVVSFNLAIAHYFQGEFGPASHLLTEAIAIGQTTQTITYPLSAIYLKTQLLRAQGALHQALQLCQEGLDLVARRGWHNAPAVGFLYVALGDVLRERGELTTAAEYLERGVKLGQAGGHPHILIIGNVWLAWLRQSEGDVTGSQEAIRAALQIDQQYEGSRFWPLPPAACYQARLWIAQGNLAAASRWAQESGLKQADTPIAYLCEVDYLTLARLLIPQGQLEAAETLLLRLHHSAAASGRGGSLIEILILQAITFAAQARTKAALSALGQALRLAEGEGFVRLFLDEGAPIAELLRQAVAQGIRAPYALHLLNLFGEVALAPQSLVEPLSERELDVLRRVAGGFSNQEIAHELVIAVSTVKKHVNNIYGKLEVGNRTQAVARARELGLL